MDPEFKICTKIKDIVGPQPLIFFIFLIENIDIHFKLGITQNSQRVTKKNNNSTTLIILISEGQSDLLPGFLSCLKIA